MLKFIYKVPGIMNEHFTFPNEKIMHVTNET